MLSGGSAQNGNHQNIDENGTVHKKSKKNKKKKKKKNKTDLVHLLVKKDSLFYKMTCQDLFDEIQKIME